MDLFGGGTQTSFGFTHDAAGRIALAARETERRMRNVRGRRARWHGRPTRTDVVFELMATLQPETDITAGAYLCQWDPSLNLCNGGWAATSKTITVASSRKNAWGIIGEQGRARVRLADDGIRYEIIENPGQPQYHGKLEYDLPVGSDSSIVVYHGDPLVDSGWGFKIWSPPLQTATIASGSWVRVACFPKEGGKFKLTGAPCE